MRRLSSACRLATATAILWTLARPDGRVSLLLHARQSADPFDPLLAGVSLLAWAVLTWLVAVLAASLTAQLPGAAGRGAAAFGRWLTPASLRGAAEIVLGASLAMGVAAPSPAFADAGITPVPPAAERGLIPQMPWWVSLTPPPAPVLAPVLPTRVDPAGGPAGASAGEAEAARVRPAVAPAPAPAVALDWPGAGERPSVRAAQEPAAGPVDRTAQTAAAGPVGLGARDRAAAGARFAAARHRARTVVVRPGDSLWRIAAAALPRWATPAAIARSWPRWWAANRTVVGPDPNLIQPGMTLVPPG